MPEPPDLPSPRTVALVLALIAWAILFAPRQPPPQPRPDPWVRHRTAEGGVEHRWIHPAGSRDCDVCWPETHANH